MSVVEDASNDRATTIIYITYDSNVLASSKVNIKQNSKRNSEYHRSVLLSSLREQSSKARYHRAREERKRV